MSEKTNVPAGTNAAQPEPRTNEQAATIGLPIQLRGVISALFSILQDLVNFSLSGTDAAKYLEDQCSLVKFYMSEVIDALAGIKKCGCHCRNTEEAARCYCACHSTDEVKRCMDCGSHRIHYRSDADNYPTLAEVLDQYIHNMWHALRETADLDKVENERFKAMLEPALLRMIVDARKPIFEGDPEDVAAGELAECLADFLRGLFAAALADNTNDPGHLHPSPTEIMDAQVRHMRSALDTLAVFLPDRHIPEDKPLFAHILTVIRELLNVIHADLMNKAINPESDAQVFAGHVSNAITTLQTINDLSGFTVEQTRDEMEQAVEMLQAKIDMVDSGEYWRILDHIATQPEPHYNVSFDESFILAQFDRLHLDDAFVMVEGCMLDLVCTQAGADELTAEFKDTAMTVQWLYSFRFPHGRFFFHSEEDFESALATIRQKPWVVVVENDADAVMVVDRRIVDTTHEQASDAVKS